VSRGAAFLGDARSRLLPASIPLLFFGTATVFHLAAWIVLAASAGRWLEFAGGLGRPLAALHLVTLGVLGMTTLGAGAQLLPVATRQPVPPARWLVAIWWLYTPGVVLLAFGMGWPDARWLAAGAVAVTIALVIWGALMLRHLVGARGMAGVVSHGWTALLALAVLLASALSLAGTWLGLPAPSREITLELHLVFASYGFMGMLSLGLSYILVPMFALSESPPERAQLLSCALAAVALLLAGGAAFGWTVTPLRIAALLCGAGAVAVHLHWMFKVLRSGMRRDLGRSFALVKIGWAGLVASLVLALALALDLPVPRLAAWLGLFLVGVWLLSFLLGMLERILPFLAAMHAAGTARRAPTPSALTDDRALRIHFACHVAALAGLVLALATGSTLLAVLAAAVGAAGALAYCLFYATLLVRLQRSAAKGRSLS
jgi:hypothetical protein